MSAISQIPPFVLKLTPGAGITLDPATGAYLLDPEALSGAGVAFTLTGRDAAGTETVYGVTVSEVIPEPVSREKITRFDGAAALASVGFLGTTPPSWTLVEGAARLVTSTQARAHGSWAEAAGDGLYRCLFRLGGGLPPTMDRRFSFSARTGFAAGNWTGIRVEPYETSTGGRRLHIREYVGASGTTNSLATVDVGWGYDLWQWLDVEVRGDQVRGRLYAADAPAPDWQISATTQQLAGGAFGPGGFPSGGIAPVVDVKELRFTPA